MLIVRITVGLYMLLRQGLGGRVVMTWFAYAGPLGRDGQFVLKIQAWVTHHLKRHTASARITAGTARAAAGRVVEIAKEA